MKKCTCGNPELGFNCVCDWVKDNAGTIEFSCQIHGLYNASTPKCNLCEGD